MKQTTVNALKRACLVIQVAIDELYEAQQAALDLDDFYDASLLQSQADKLYEDVINLEHLINELEDYENN